MYSALLQVVTLIGSLPSLIPLLDTLPGQQQSLAQLLSSLAHLTESVASKSLKAGPLGAHLFSIYLMLDCSSSSSSS